MTLLDRYIFKSVLFTCAAAVGMLSFVFILVSALRDMLGYVLAGQIAWSMVAKLLLLLLPATMPFVLAPGILTGVLLTLGRLSADSEITAMRAAGLSLPRIARPIFILAALGVAAGLYVNYEAMPHGRVRYEQELADALRTNALGLIVPRTFVRNFPNTVIYVDSKQGDLLQDIWLWKFDSQKRTTLFVRAPSGNVSYDEEKNTLEVRLLQAQGESRNEAHPEDFSKMVDGSFGVLPLSFPLDKVFNRDHAFRRKAQWLTFNELRAEHARLAALQVPPAEARDHARDLMKVQMVLSDKANTALAVLSFALLGVPLGIKVSRRETSANLGVAVLLVLGYYFLTVMIGWIDRHPEYRPDLLLWAPNLIFLTLGTWLFWRLDRR
ncbi:MAG TPA: LptF/LptG family permease [Opitutaceae bacterium]|nr:LptF/LptG family permease [Opitutaceae bacterium]